MRKLPGIVEGPLTYVLNHIFDRANAKLTPGLAEDIIGRIGKNPGMLPPHLHQAFFNAVQQSFSEDIPEDLSFTAAELISFLGPDSDPDMLFTKKMGHDTASVDDSLADTVRSRFTEELSSAEHEDARDEYEQVMAEAIHKSLHELGEEIAAMKAAGTLKDSKYAGIDEEAFSSVLDSIKSPEELQPAFASALDRYFAGFDKKLDKLLHLGKHTSDRISHIDDRAARIEKGINKGLILFCCLLLVVVAGAVAAYFYLRDETFSVTLDVRDEHNQLLPAGTVLLSFGNIRKAANIGPDGLMVFPGIPPEFKGDSAAIVLGTELNKDYELDQVTSKAVLTAGEVVTVRVRKKASQGVTVPGRIPTVPTDNRPASTDVINAKSLDGAAFGMAASPDSLVLTYINDNILSFRAELGYRDGEGTMELIGNGLRVRDGNVSGNLSLLDNNSHIRGKLLLTERNNQSKDIDMWRK